MCKSLASLQNARFSSWEARKEVGRRFLRDRYSKCKKTPAYLASEKLINGHRLRVEKVTRTVIH